ncbi:MAG: FAD-binding oxidoreductase, partial [Nitrospinota bacterium]
GIPKGADLLLSLKRFNRVIEHDAPNLTATLEVGLKVGEAQSILKERGQFLPLDTPFSEEATLGGALATAATGPRRLAWGGPRDIVLGLKVVLPGGEVISPGGKVIKNVAGYDLLKLFIGSLGTLGIILEATFRLLPLPEARATIGATFGGLEPSLSASREVLSSRLEPAALALLNPEASKELTGNDEEGVLLLVGVEGLRVNVERQVEEFRALALGKGATRAEPLGEEVWERLSPLMAKSPGEMPWERTILKLGVSLSDLEKLLKALPPSLASAPLLSLPGSGHLYVSLRHGEGEGEMDWALERGLVLELAKMAEGLGGHWTLLSASHRLKKMLPSWSSIPPGLSLMERLKDKFDPLRVLNPGRFVGGI